ncbi:hypothetical protein, partial [Bacillus wiedmannii]|uniref:hypothetical protein n=1 Tax=Bacillus wiedmannii TaxID=1890302 RepID=UPI000D4D3C0D
QLNVTAFIPAFSQLVIVIKIDNPPVSCLHTYEETCRANSVFVQISPVLIYVPVYPKTKI